MYQYEYVRTVDKREGERDYVLIRSSAHLLFHLHDIQRLSLLTLLPSLRASGKRSNWIDGGGESGFIQVRHLRTTALPYANPLRLEWPKQPMDGRRID